MKARTAFLTAALGAVAGGMLVKKVWLKKFHLQQVELIACNEEKELLYTWLLLEQKKIELGEYFAAYGYSTIAIMGMNREGRRLFDALKCCEDVSPLYAAELDNFSAVHKDMIVYRLGDDPLPPADCMVICDLNNVSLKLEAARNEFKGRIVTLPEVLAWLIDRHQIKPWDGAIRDWPPK